MSSTVDFDVIVVGAGHAGVEASLAAARMGQRVACVTLRLDRIGYLPCNCSVGGPAKGHMAREVDALGGQMGLIADQAVTHIRKVGTGKGPTVLTLRAHVCKDLYPQLMRATLEAQKGLTVIQDAVVDLVTSGGRVTGVVLESGAVLTATAVVLTTGTFLNGLCHEGQIKTVASRSGDRTLGGVSAALQRFGVRLRRFKTGTTPRVRLQSLNLERCLEIPSDDDTGPFSYRNDALSPRHALLSCWQTWTNPDTHDTVRESLHESAMYSGQIQGVGPRYCPSIEDKVVRFADKERHPIFLEVETWSQDEVYVQGVSTSLPKEVQQRLLSTVPGLENAEIVRPGYAVEYDMADPLQLHSSLMSQLMDGLFLAGQLNGTSGYEEAAGQGIVAGINAARFSRNEPPVEFPRSQSFIGVMIDDLVTKGVDDPYRMLTARAEHRLHLRSDNADERLTPVARQLGLCDDIWWSKFEEKQEAIEAGLSALKSATVSPANAAGFSELGEALVEQKQTFFDLLRRPGYTCDTLEGISKACAIPLEISDREDVRRQIELAGMYAGYIVKFGKALKQFDDLESIKIPSDFPLETVIGLSHEGREKMLSVRPASVGQAARIPGVRMSDIAFLIGRIRHKSVLQEEKTATPV